MFEMVSGGDMKLKGITIVVGDIIDSPAGKGLIVVQIWARDGRRFKKLSYLSTGKGRVRLLNGYLSGLIGTRSITKCEK